MRTVIVIVVIVVALAAIGWLSFGTPQGEPTIQIETEEVEQDTEDMARAGSRAVEEVGDRLSGEPQP